MPSRKKKSKSWDSDSRGRTRPPLKRLYDLKALIEEGNYPNCNTLAARMEVSAKTIQRDITFMRDRLGVPVEYDAQRFGFYFSGPVKLDEPLDVSEGELVAIMIAQKALEQHRGSVFEKPLLSACRKIEEALKGRISVNLSELDTAVSFRDLGAPEIDAEIFEAAGRAVGGGLELEFLYTKLGAERAERRVVRPYHLGCMENQWYLFGYDPQRNGMRTFALARLEEPVVTARKFERPEGFTISEYLMHSLNVFRVESEPREVSVEFDAWASGLIRKRHWHQSQRMEDLPGGKVRLSLRLSSFEELERWVLGFGEHARVVEPPDFVERMRWTAERLAQAYRMGDGSAD